MYFIVTYSFTMLHFHTQLSDSITASYPTHPYLTHAYDSSSPLMYWFISTPFPIVVLWLTFLSTFLLMMMFRSISPGYVPYPTGTMDLPTLYTQVLSHTGRVCSTCRVLKPPRSKHCAICDR